MKNNESLMNTIKSENLEYQVLHFQKKIKKNVRINLKSWPPASLVMMVASPYF